jgi:hypothetical protein
MRRSPLVLSLVTLAIAAGACDNPPRQPDPAEATPRQTLAATPSPTTSPSPAAVVASRLKRSPDDCPGPPPRRREVAPAYAPLVGEEPLWAGFYATYDAEGHTFSTRDAPRTRHGFRVKVLWIMSPRYDDGVTLTGENLRTGARVRFHFEGMGTTESPTLTPEVAGISETKWREFPSYLYFDRAGCFMLTATWGDDSWQLGFGFGT